MPRAQPAGDAVGGYSHLSFLFKCEVSPGISWSTTRARTRTHRPDLQKLTQGVGHEFVNDDNVFALIERAERDRHQDDDPASPSE